MKLKDKNGNILNVITKAAYQSLLKTGNYFKVEEKPVEEKPVEENTNENKDKKEDKTPKK